MPRAERRRRLRDARKAARRARRVLNDAIDGKLGPAVFFGPKENAVLVPGDGAIFSYDVGGLQVFEAVAFANPGEARPVIDARHARLERVCRRALGDRVVDAAKARRAVAS